MNECLREARNSGIITRHPGSCFVFSGMLTMEREGETHTLVPQNGIEISPGARHPARNEANTDVEFLVVSHPTTRGDRTDLKEH